MDSLHRLLEAEASCFACILLTFHLDSIRFDSEPRPSHEDVAGCWAFTARRNKSGFVGHGLRSSMGTFFLCVDSGGATASAQQLDIDEANRVLEWSKQRGYRQAGILLPSLLHLEPPRQQCRASVHRDYIWDVCCGRRDTSSGALRSVG